MTEREFATEVVKRLQAAGFQALWAGGCVRDERLGIAPADYDVATSAKPDQVQRLFPRTHAFGASFGVVEVLGPRDDAGEWTKVQVATFRSDGLYSDGRRPDTVTYSSPEEDAQRRDFTLNGLFFDPVTGQIHDFVGGLADLEARVLRAIGDPVARFTEDKLRILRAVRMAARFELSIDPMTQTAARTMADQIRVVSAERIAEELRKILTHQHRARGAQLLRDFGLVDPILPEVADPSTWERRVQVLAALPHPVSFPVAFAALLHDRPGNEVVAVTKRLRMSNQEVDQVCWLVARVGELVQVPNWPWHRLKPLLVDPGCSDLRTLGETLARVEGEPWVSTLVYCEAMRQKWTPEQLDPTPLLTGDDLRAAGLKPGKQFKTMIEAVRAAQLDERITTKQEALELARSLLESPGP